MKIDDQTKISAIVKHNSASIDAIASVAKPLEKLRNPILRKIMASRVTIAEAAKLGGCTTEDLMNALKPLGYVYDDQTQTAKTTTEEPEPLWLRRPETHSRVDFDVRDMLASGNDPLKQIMQRYGAIAPGQVLCIINTFSPTPLIHLLRSKGAETFVKEINAGEYHTFFLKPGAATAVKEASPLNYHDEKSFHNKAMQFDGSYNAIDVRLLEMPLPMQTILKELKDLPQDKALYVYHKKVPVYLLDELYDMNFITHIHEVADGDVRLLIHHA
ncbi:MAG TPA: DUF2249 domain-containing protein [Sphingobacteriaceae bacterium]